MPEDENVNIDTGGDGGSDEGQGTDANIDDDTNTNPGEGTNTDSGEGIDTTPTSDTTEIGGDDSGNSSDSGSQTINIQIVNANRLTGADEPNNGLSFIMVDRATNTGILLDYNKLAETIYNKLYSDNLEEDSLKVYFID